jgi:hypothetical protein
MAAGRNSGSLVLLINQQIVERWEKFCGNRLNPGVDQVSRVLAPCLASLPLATNTPPFVR